ncbi:coproporphyrinogen-III oxidase 2, chloroplastic-like [Quercus robur]|uniref:coproporphyrinogen-III oxidase 2, chloroplastic-like n=1 Tax=Quercus robur TaxID=38942 RepID=UPI002163ED8A|nr:coproporphyrinogen-III oxidase 2, chloroplastic-like [Quercus robur]
MSPPTTASAIVSSSSSSSYFTLFPLTSTSPKSKPTTKLSFNFSKTQTRNLTLKTTTTTTIRSAVSIEKEVPETERPNTFLRESDDHDSPSSSSSSSSTVRSRFEKMIRKAQDSVCKAIEGADGGAKFKEDVWSRPSGDGGISRVLQDGAVWEKAGVNVSVVYGVMPLEAYRAATASAEVKPGPVPFFADGEGRRGLGWSVAATVMSEAGVIWEMRVREKEIEGEGD